MRKKLWSTLICVILAGMTILSAFAASGPIGYMYTNTSKRLLPDDTRYAQVEWSVSDSSVLNASNGVVNALETGRAVVTARLNGKVRQAGIIVIPKTLELTVGQTTQLPTVRGTTYRMGSTSVAKITSGGKITAVKKGTTSLTVKYGTQKLSIAITVKADGTQQSKAASLSCSSTATQIVLVEYTSGSNAVLSLHEKRNGVWTELGSCSAYVGKNGIGKTKEGDKRTPTGTYNLTTPFGIKADPGARMPYTKVTKYHYWCGASSSQYYNQLVDSRVTGRSYTSSDEHLIDYTGYYNYCMFIDYNAAGVAGKGSCIFLHCTGGRSYTAGCIAISESMMKKIIQWADTGCKIVIR